MGAAVRLFGPFGADLGSPRLRFVDFGVSQGRTWTPRGDDFFNFGGVWGRTCGPEWGGNNVQTTQQTSNHPGPNMQTLVSSIQFSSILFSCSTITITFNEPTNKHSVLQDRYVVILFSYRAGGMRGAIKSAVTLAVTWAS